MSGIPENPHGVRARLQREFGSGRDRSRDPSRPLRETPTPGALPAAPPDPVAVAEELAPTITPGPAPTAGRRRHLRLVRDTDPQ